MRPSRFSILSAPHGIVHLYWRCHNSEFLLDRPGAKTLFFQSLIRGLRHPSAGDSVKLHAFCLMSNHVHQLMSYQNGPAHLSNVMRVAHGIFGRLFNKAFKRSGKVANERPKTPLIGDRQSEMRVHFYIEANPIRARMVKLEKLRFDPWNSYRFFAHGEVNEVTASLTPPAWYLELGSTPAERMSAYQKLFREYVEKGVVEGTRFLRRFIGAVEWVSEREQQLKTFLKSRRMALQSDGPSSPS